MSLNTVSSLQVCRRHGCPSPAIPCRARQARLWRGGDPWGKPDPSPADRIILQLAVPTHVHLQHDDAQEIAVLARLATADVWAQQRRGLRLWGLGTARGRAPRFATLERTAVGKGLQLDQRGGAANRAVWYCGRVQGFSVRGPLLVESRRGARVEVVTIGNGRGFGELLRAYF